MKFQKYLTALLPFLLWSIWLSGQQYSISTIPDPKIINANGYVSNPDNILSPAETAEINGICEEIEAQTSAEVAVVVVADIDQQNVPDFAGELFNYWGIGKAGNNNGLLLFVARDKRKYQFVTGYGMEGQLSDGLLSDLAQKYIVPNFRKEAYGQGITAVLREIKKALTSEIGIAALKKSLEPPSLFEKLRWPLSWSVVIIGFYFLAFHRMNKLKEKYAGKLSGNNGEGIAGCLIIFSVIIFIFVIAGIFGFKWAYLPAGLAIIANILIFIKDWNIRRNIVGEIKDIVTETNTLNNYYKDSFWVMLFTPLTLLALPALKKRNNIAALHLTPPDESGNWVRLNRNDKNVSKNLSRGQRSEEKERTMFYEVWRNNVTHKTVLTSFEGSTFKRYNICPGCGNRTLAPTEIKTITKPTYASSGKGQEIRKCRHCKHTEILGIITLAKLVAASSSSSSGSSSSSSSRSSSRSSSSGGSWGGGRSGGGGAGGGW